MYVFIICVIFISQGYAEAKCRFPGAPAHCSVFFSDESLTDGTYALYECERGFELLGPARRVCGSDGRWTPDGIPFCVLNVAAGKAPMQISTEDGGVPQKALDGSTAAVFTQETCTLTKTERVPWWYVNLLEPYMVQLVRLDFGKPCCGANTPAVVVVRVGNNRPDLGTNPICNRFTGTLEEGQPLFLPCNPPMPGAFVSVHLEANTPSQLSICESFVYTDQALPIERCPQFRDQPPGSTATYNGKCYIFYNRQPATFKDALAFCRSRGGTLVDESNPALQGFISWELWRRHRGDSNSQYWMGAVRDTRDPTSWKWINGNDVTVSFWNTPGGGEGCARFDGSAGWLWSDTDCQTRLNYICQHRPKACGGPEQPPNSTIRTTNFDVGSSVEYACDEGHLLVGPTVRTCLDTGFYDEFPPVCKRIECGYPAEISNGVYDLINGSTSYLSHVQYACKPGYEMFGRSRLICDIDERWNGPPPRCDAILCEPPAQISNGRVLLSHNASVYGSVAEYSCTPPFVLLGHARQTCLSSGFWDQPAPICKLALCKPPAQIPNGRVVLTHNSTAYGSVAEYSCDPEFELQGYARQKCLSSGVWDQLPPTCITQNRATTTTSIINRITAPEKPLQTTTLFSEPVTTSTPGFSSVPPKRARPKTNSSQVTTIPYKRITSQKVTNADNQNVPTGHIPHIIVASHAKENQAIVSNGSNIRAEQTPRVQVPQPVDGKRNDTIALPTGARFNTGALVAIGIFLILVLLIGTTTAFMLVKFRPQSDGNRYQHHVSPDCVTVASLNSSTSESRSGLSRYYRQAWVDLHEATGNNHGQRHERHEREAPKDGSELVVTDVYPGVVQSRPDKRRHHHHHHHREQRQPDWLPIHRTHHNHKPRY